MRRARVEGLIDTMTYPHDFLFLRELLLDIGIDFVFAPDFLQHPDNTFIRAAVERTFKCADGRSNRGVEVTECRDRNPGTKSGSVHAVIGMENKGHVERIGSFL